jgi:hypothetical protein
VAPKQPPFIDLSMKFSSLSKLIGGGGRLMH